MTEQERIARLEEDLRRSAERERELSTRLDDLSRRLDELAEEKAVSVFAEGDVADGENGDVEPLFEMPDSVNAAQARFFVSPDEVLTQGAGVKRKSLSLTPETDGGLQIHEFDDAPSVGNISIKRAGRKLLLTDPDGTSGQRKWMVPLRRETQDAIEIKWVQLGEGSDSDSDSDADFPCQDEYMLDESDGDCGTTISLKRQEYIRGSGGVCVPDGSPVVAGSVTVPDPPEYSMSVSGGSCAKTLALYKIPCGGSASRAGDSFTFNVPPEITASATGSSGGGSLAGTVSIIPCGGTQTDINIYNGHDGQNGCTPAVSASATGNSSGGALAGTVSVTPCGGTKTDIKVYNGKDGSDAAVSGASTPGTASTGCRDEGNVGFLFVADLKYVSGTGIQARFCRLNIQNGLIKSRALCDDWTTIIGEQACS